MSYFFIINPNAGRRHGDILRRIERFFAGRKVRYEAEFTKFREHASELSAKAAMAGFAQIIAAGGDGTIRETAIPLIGKTASLGILPCGSGNGLARNLYIPLDFNSALEGLVSWKPRAIDAGLANGRPFFCAAGVGLDAEIARDFNSMSGRRGIFPYVWHGARRVFFYKPPAIAINADGRRFESRALVNGILNGVQYGGGAKMAPGAYIDDGLLDLVAIKNASPAPADPRPTRAFQRAAPRTAGHIFRYEGQANRTGLRHGDLVPPRRRGFLLRRRADKVQRAALRP